MHQSERGHDKSHSLGGVWDTKGGWKSFSNGRQTVFLRGYLSTKNELFWPSESTNTFLENQKNQGNIKKARRNNKTPHKV